MRKRLGECEYCGVPIMDDDHYCVGCGAPALSPREVIEIPDPSRYGQSFYADGGVSIRETPALYADWNAD